MHHSWLVRDGKCGLLIALILVASVSVGLSLKPESAAELCIDVCIVGAAVLALLAVALANRFAEYFVFVSVCLLGIAWGGHAVTRESVGNIKACVGVDPVLVFFRAAIAENFHQPDVIDIDLLDSFQNAVDPPRYRALVNVIQIKNRNTILECQGIATLFISGNGSEFSVGDIVEGVGWLRGLAEPHNPGESDFRVRAFRLNHAANISAAGNPVVINKINFKTNFVAIIHRWLCGWVDKNLLHVMDGVANTKIKTLVVAMTTGRELPGYQALRQSFSFSGLSHFLAISGFNLAVLFGAAWICMELFHFPWAIRGWFLVLTSLVFLFVVDVETSVLRAGIAGILLGVSVACDRGWKADGLLAVAAIFTLICDPWAAWNPGFQLSYGAVLALRYGTDPILRSITAIFCFFPLTRIWFATGLKRPIVTALSASLAAWFMSTPITESHFGSLSLWAAVASTVLAPIAAIITVLASLSCLVGLLPGAWFILGYPLSFFSNIFLWLSEFVGTLPAANIQGGLIPWWWSVIELMALAGCWLGVWLWIKRLSVVVYLSLFIASIFFPISVANTPTSGWRLRMTTISVGDGSAHIIETPNSCVLFDAGTISRRAGGSKLIIPALKAIGCSRLNAIFISHPHLDHFSALPEIVAAFQVERVYATESLLQFANSQHAPGILIDALQKRGLSVELFSAGQTAVFDGFVWTALHPKIGYRSRIMNESSLVMRIEPQTKNQITEAHKNSLSWLMLCGDAQTEAIANVLVSKDFDPTMVMELPHHGAWSDGIVGLIAGSKPKVVIQSTGYQRFRFDRVAQAIQNISRGVTCRDGALRVTWIQGAPGNGFTYQILLERWREKGWFELERHTIVK